MTSQSPQRPDQSAQTTSQTAQRPNQSAQMTSQTAQRSNQSAQMTSQRAQRTNQTARTSDQRGKLTRQSVRTSGQRAFLSTIWAVFYVKASEQLKNMICMGDFSRFLSLSIGISWTSICFLNLKISFLVKGTSGPSFFNLNLFVWINSECQTTNFCSSVKCALTTV